MIVLIKKITNTCIINEVDVHLAPKAEGEHLQATSW